MKNVITRSVGFEPTLAIDIYQMAVKSGDTFLICSDGLTGMVDDATILEIAQRNLFTENPDTQRVADFLITTANANGGDDNITVCIIQIA
jgi:protein phosphatase